MSIEPHVSEYTFCKRCNCTRRYENGPWTSCENDECAHPMCDHAIGCSFSKNELIALIDQTSADFDEQFPFGPDRQRFAPAMQQLGKLRRELANEKRPLIPEGTWQRLIDAVEVDGDDDDYAWYNFSVIVSRLRFITPDQVR